MEQHPDTPPHNTIRRSNRNRIPNPIYKQGIKELKRGFKNRKVTDEDSIFQEEGGDSGEVGSGGGENDGEWMKCMMGGEGEEKEVMVSFKVNRPVEFARKESWNKKVGLMRIKGEDLGREKEEGGRKDKNRKKSVAPEVELMSAIQAPGTPPRQELQPPFQSPQQPIDQADFQSSPPPPALSQPQPHPPLHPQLQHLAHLAQHPLSPMASNLYQMLLNAAQKALAPPSQLASEQQQQCSSHSPDSSQNPLNPLQKRQTKQEKQGKLVSVHLSGDLLTFNHTKLKTVEVELKPVPTKMIVEEPQFLTNGMSLESVRAAFRNHKKTVYKSSIFI